MIQQHLKILIQFINNNLDNSTSTNYSYEKVIQDVPTKTWFTGRVIL